MKKRLFLPSLLIILFPVFCPAQLKPDVLHYRFGVDLSDSNDVIRGNASIHFRALEDISSFTIDLAGIDPRSGKGMSITSVKEGSATLAFRHNDDKLEIDLGSRVQRNQEKTIEISYYGIPRDGLIISKNKYGDRTFFADNWPNRGHNWLPCVDDPADKATVEFIVQAPGKYEVVANGLLIETTSLLGDRKLSHWREDVPLATKVMVIGVADFAVQLSGMIEGCIPVTSWVYPQDRTKGFYDFAQAAEILPYFISYIGPYGYKKLANVQSKTIFGGLENANTIFYAESAVTGERKKEDLLAHEIAHQWFGDMVTETSFAHLWLSEGFATYLTILYMENKHGPEKAKQMLEEDRQQVIAFSKKNSTPVVDEQSSYMDLLNPNSYQKGGWVLHMLRRQLGDSVFHRSIRSFYAAYAGRNANTDDLRKIFEKESGRDLKPFFQQWLYTPGQPVLDISWGYSATDRRPYVIVTQKQETPFQFPLELSWKNVTGKIVTQTFDITQATQRFLLPGNEKISGLKADPQVSLLFEGSVSEKK